MYYTAIFPFTQPLSVFPSRSAENAKNGQAKPPVGCVFRHICYNSGEVITLDKQILGAFIAENRRRRHLTQQQLAQMLHVTDKAVSKWERGVSHS